MIDWRHWHNEPYLVGGLIFLGWAYGIACGPLRGLIAPGQPWPRRQAACFYTSLLIFYLAVGSPLDQIGERFLLSAHMIQHQLLIYPAAVLMLFGLPTWLVGTVTGRPGLRSLLRVLTHPIICGLLYTLIMSAWHVPALYDWALQDKFVHVVEHVTFFIAALFYWWPLLSPSKEFPPAGRGAQMLYLIAVTIGMTPVFAFITFSSDVLYPTYEYAPRLFASFSPTDDQLLGGAIMKLGGLSVTLIAFAFAFYDWYQKETKVSR
ncbi:MAG TPA: cytochrome c oxidase assembly protein [Opitutaceae bacterium]